MWNWTVLTAIVFAVSIGQTSFAQEWTEFTTLEDRFSINFPGQPEVSETIWISEYGADLPARVYSATRGEGRYSLTVVDYNYAEPILTAQSKECPVGAEPCDGLTSIAGAGYWRFDVRGAIVYASWQFIQRDAELTHYMWTDIARVETHLLQLTNNADQSRTYVTVSMYDNRLYIVEATVPSDYPPPGLFQQSITIHRDPERDEQRRREITQIQYYNGAHIDDVDLGGGNRDRATGEVIDPSLEEGRGRGEDPGVNER